MFISNKEEIKAPDGSLIHGLSELFDKFGVVQVIGIFAIGLILYGAYKVIYSWAITKFEERSKHKDQQIQELTDMLREYTKKEHNISTRYIDSDSFTNLKSHPFFDNLNVWMGLRLGQMRIEPESKFNIFKDFLYIKMSVMKKNWSEFIQNSNLTNITRDELKSSINNLLIKINDETLIMVDSANFPTDILKALNNSSILADKLISNAIDGFITNEHFVDCYDSLYTILQVNMSILEVIVYDLVTLMNNLNGSLDHIKYETKFYKK